MNSDADAVDEELLLTAGLVREPAMADGHTHLVSSGGEEFADTDLGTLFDRLREIRAASPDLSGIGIRYNLDPALHLPLDRALAAWDREAEQRHPQLPVCADEIEMLAASINRRWRHRTVERLAGLMQHHYRSGDNDRAGEIATEIRSLVRTHDDQWEDNDPYADHTLEVLHAELAAADNGRGFSVHPKLDSLLHRRSDWRGELILLAAKTKVGKSRLAGWWAVRLMLSASQLAPEAQVVIFCTEMERPEITQMLTDYLAVGQHVMTNTPKGRPRFLLFGKEFFGKVGTDVQNRLRAVNAEIRRFASANLNWARHHDLDVADCWFAGIFVDYLTSMLAVRNDFSVCEEFVRGVDTSLRVFDPGWFGLDLRRFGELVGLRCNVVVCEQVNARRETAGRVTVDPHTGQASGPPLDPPAPTEINGARSTFEVATVYCMLARDWEGKIHPVEHAVMRISGRSAATREMTLRFVGGLFEIPGGEAPTDHATSTARTLPNDSPDAAAAEPDQRDWVWTLPCYVLAPPAAAAPDGTLTPCRDRWVPVDAPGDDSNPGGKAGT